MRVPVRHLDSPEAAKAWSEHSALLKALRDAPTLAERPEFTVLRQDAYERFHETFKGR